MIKITGLDKIYESKNHLKHHALQDINLVLPNTGLVFVLGKSGSGKSTLLNIIGGLDRATNGSLSVNGNNLSTLSQEQFVAYRNNCIGFIFQDHHLIDDLTVYENIKLALDLQNSDDIPAISEALRKVGLAGYEGRSSKELSGGERQRVAIARAIVKEPQIILADEPTGNLDSKNATDVMRILKELSKNCLVLTVSHNTTEVYTYADRILELSRGRIIRDFTRNPDFPCTPELVDDTLYLPADHKMTQEDITFVNQQLSANGIKQLTLRKDKFYRTPPLEEEETYSRIHKTRLKFRQVLNLSFAFLRSKVMRILGSSISLALILLVILLAQTYINFDANRIMQEQMEKAGQDYVVLSKQISIDGIRRNARIYHAAVTSADLRALMNTGFKGKTYPVLNVSVPITTYRNASGVKSSFFSYGVVATESLGTIVTDEAFLEEKFGQVEYLARARNFDPLGVVITDYLADVILYSNGDYKGKTYRDLLGSYSMKGWGMEQITINGVINTNYKERYDELIDRISEEKVTNPSILYDDEEFQKLASEIYGLLSYSYSFNPNFEAEYQAANRPYLWSYKLTVNNGALYTISPGYVLHDTSKGLSGNQVLMGYQMYNDLFGTKYNADNLGTFKPQTVTLSQYEYHDMEKSSPLFTMEVRITGLYNGNTMYVGDAVKAQFAENHVRQTGVFMDGMDHISDVLDVGTERSFIQESLTIEGILTMTRIVQVFSSIFQIINIGLCAAMIMIFISFATKMIKDKLHEIGILKALGTDSGTVSFIFGLQIVLVAVTTCILGTIGYSFLVDVSNNLLIVSLRGLTSSQLVLNLRFLVFHPVVVLRNYALILFLTIISMLIPLVKISRIQPVKIINDRE